MTIRRAALAAALLLAALAARPSHAQRAFTPADVHALIQHYAAAYGVSAPWLLAVAECESGLQPYAVGRLGEVGAFQWHPRGLWPYTPDGRIGVSPWDVEANIRNAAWAFSRGLSFHWSCARV